MKTFVLFMNLTVFLGFHINSATCTSTLIGGNWNNPLTWSCGHVPSCGDDIVIPFLSIVTVTANVNLSACPSPINISVSGELIFTSNKSISLPAGSCFEIQSLGIMNPSLNLFSTNLISIGGVPVWSGTLLTLPVVGPKD